MQSMVLYNWNEPARHPPLNKRKTQVPAFLSTLRGRRPCLPAVRGFTPLWAAGPAPRYPPVFSLPRTRCFRMISPTGAPEPTPYRGCLFPRPLPISVPAPIPAPVPASVPILIPAPVLDSASRSPLHRPFYPRCSSRSAVPAIHCLPSPPTLPGVSCVSPVLLSLPRPFQNRVCCVVRVQSHRDLFQFQKNAYLTFH